MFRWASLLIVVSACAASPPAARLFAPGTGECTDPAGCEVPLDAEPKYASPDDSKEVPDQEPELGPSEKRVAGCEEVANSVAAIEIGNYADDETRRPAVTRYRARCHRTALTAVERQCVFEANDAVAIAWCAPRFWPQTTLEVVAHGDCAQIASEIGDRMKNLPKGEPHWSIGQRQLWAVQRSCEEDRWTAQVGACARDLPMAAYIISYCAHLAPDPLRLRLEDRIANASK